VPVHHVPGRHRHRRPGFDLRSRPRRVLHPVRPQLGPGHLEGRAVGDLRRIPHRLHVHDAARHRGGAAGGAGAPCHPRCEPLTGQRRLPMTSRPGARMLAVALTVALASPVVSAHTPGATPTEIKIGNTNPYSGPASAYGTIGKAIGAYFKKVNDEGGINGRKINYITYD